PSASPPGRLTGCGPTLGPGCGRRSASRRNNSRIRGVVSGGLRVRGSGPNSDPHLTGDRTMAASRFSLFTKLFRRTPKTIRNPKPVPCARLDLTALEDRLVRAASLTASLDMNQGVLWVEGTEDTDQIRIIHQDGSVAVEGIQITLTDREGNVSQVD